MSFTVSIIRPETGNTTSADHLHIWKIVDITTSKQANPDTGTGVTNKFLNTRNEKTTSLMIFLVGTWTPLVN